MGGAFSSRPEPTINKNHHISWFNSVFEKAEKTLNQLMNELFDNGNSEINKFNEKTIFNVIENLNGYLDSYIDSNNGESIISVQRNKHVLEYLFKLYSTQLTKFQDYDLNNFSNFKKMQIVLNNLEIINNNSQNIINVVNQYINNNNNNLDTFFNDNFLRENNIIQYLRLLLNMVTCLENKVQEQIRYFKQENRNFGETLFDYTFGCINNLFLRNGYSYSGTANFYTYWLNNNIRNIRNNIQRKIDSIEAIIDKTIIQNQQNIIIYGHLSNFNIKVDYFNYHVIDNLTDDLSITFINNNNEINISIKINNYIISCYEEFIAKLNNCINEKLHNNGENQEIEFLMRYESDDIKLNGDNHSILNPPLFKYLINNVILLSNVSFRINICGILQLIGMNDFNKVDSIHNPETGIHSIISRRILKNEEINLVINKKFRITELINLLNSINTSMGKHNVNLNN